MYLEIFLVFILVYPPCYFTYLPFVWLRLVVYLLHFRIYWLFSLGSVVQDNIAVYRNS